MNARLIITIFFVASFLMDCATARKAGSSAIGETKRGYTISLPNQVMEIDAISGAKVDSLTLDGTNFLTDSLVHKNYWGSSFWISPEAVWDWSVADFDKKPYTSRVENGKIILTSPKTGNAQLVDYVRKVIH